MRYYGLSVVAVATFAACVYFFCTELTAMLEVGTCASGGPYVTARPCPDEVTGSFWLLSGSILGLFVAMGIVGLRGPRPGGGGFGFGSYVLIGWAIFFSAVGAASLIHSLTSDTIPEDGKLGGTIVGITFLVMGVPVLLAIPLIVKNAIQTARGTQSGSTVFAGNAPGGEGWLSALKTGSTSASPFGVAEDNPAGERAELDTLVQLERLQKLREAGALTESEFAAQKARILSSGR